MVLSVKCYLIFCKDNEVKKFRLYGFGEKDLEKLLAVLREKQMKYMEIEKRFALVETYEKNASEALFSERKREHSSTVCTDLADDKTVKGEYLLPPKQLIAKEKNTVRKIGLIFLGLTIFLALFTVREIIAGETVAPLLVVILCAAFLMLLMLPVHFLTMKQKERICARRILIGGEFIQIGEDTYTYTGTESIRLTSPRKESDSIFPVQRYLTVRAGGKKHKYWLGSQSSFGDYEKLCQELEQAMVFYPMKLEYGK